MVNPDIKAALQREAYFKFLSDVIVQWQSDPKGYDLRAVAHELRKAGAPELEGVRPGDFVAMLGRCKRRGANPPEPVPPVSALQLRDLQARKQQLLEEKGVLLEAQPLYSLPALFRKSWQHPWEAVKAPQEGDATSRLVLFDWPQAPVGEILFLGAEMGSVPGSDGKRLWYRAYYKVNRSPDTDVQILAEGTTTSAAGGRTVVKRRLLAFVREQCEAEPLLEEPEPPLRGELYTVQVRLTKSEVDDLGGWRHQAEVSAVVTKALRKCAAERRKLREERAAARRARKEAAET